MARVQIPVTTIARGGTALPSSVTGDATNDHYIAGNDGQIILIATNTSGGALTITIQSAITVDGLAVDDVALSVAAGATRYFAIGPPHVYNQQADNGFVYVDVTSNSWSLWAIRMAAI